MDRGIYPDRANPASLSSDRPVPSAGTVDTQTWAGGPPGMSSNGEACPRAREARDGKGARSRLAAPV